jgi:hypothetical protein
MEFDHRMSGLAEGCGSRSAIFCSGSSKFEVNSKFKYFTSPKPHRPQYNLGSMGTWNSIFCIDPPAK